MKKGLFVVSFIFLFVSLFFSGVVSAQTPDAGVVAGTENVINKVLGVLSPVTKLLIGDTGSKSSIFFAKFLLLILVVSLVYFPVSNFPGIGSNRFLRFSISLIVGLLGVRFLSDEIISTITLPYSAFAIAVTVLFPLILYFIWVEKALVGKPAMRKIAWIFAAVVFVGLFFTRYDEVSALSDGFNPLWYYMIAAGLSIIFLFADKTIQRAWMKAERANFAELEMHEKKAELLEKYYRYEKQFDDGHLTVKQFNNLIKTKIWRIAKSHNVSESLFPLKSE